MEGSSTAKRENPDQIPQEDDTRGKTGSVISKQAGVQGQRKQVNVESYSKVAALGQILKDMNFPADKNKIVAFARQQQQKTTGVNNKTVEDKEDILSDLQNLEEREYNNVSDVSSALGYVY